MFSYKTIGISKVILWYIVGIALTSIYVFVDFTRLEELIETADKHKPGGALVLLIVYAVSKYLTVIAGLIMIFGMTIMLILKYVLKRNDNFTRN